MSTPEQTAQEIAESNVSSIYVNLITELVTKGIEADRAQRESAAFSNVRDLTDLDRELTNPEYLRGQVELIADLFGIEKESVYAKLGVEEL